MPGIFFMMVVNEATTAHNATISLLVMNEIKDRDQTANKSKCFIFNY